jgi:beta-lactamase superfamily II metal-dependent hydrolase
MARIHFLNVGHGDCTVIEHNSGRLTVIDINNGQDLDETSADEIAESYNARFDLTVGTLLGEKRASVLASKGYDIPLTNPVEFLTANYPGQPIFRYVQTHPDLDHMRGISRMGAARIEILNFWDTTHAKVPEFGKWAGDKEDWAEYQRLRAGSNPKVFRHERAAKGVFWNQDQSGGTGDGIHILSPTAALTESVNQSANPNWNNLSYVLMLIVDGVRIVLGGDAEEAAWEDIHKTYGANLRCNILKASHHGRDSGYHQPSVAAMSPEYAIVSVGKKPATDASNKYRQYCDNVWSTRWRGDITVTTGPRGFYRVDSQFDRTPSAYQPA